MSLGSPRRLCRLEQKPPSVAVLPVRDIEAVEINQQCLPLCIGPRIPSGQDCYAHCSDEGCRLCDMQLLSSRSRLKQSCDTDLLYCRFSAVAVQVTVHRGSGALSYQNAYL